MAKSKFNLTGLLNQRSMELVQEQAGAAEETKEAGRQEGAAGSRENEIVMVDVEDLVPSKDNFYHVDSDLKRSIELVGVLQPLLVNKPENGKYKVMAGHRRRLAAMELVKEGKEKFRFLPCVYKKEDVMDRLAIIMANRFREKTDWEKMTEAVEAEELAKELKKEYSIEGRTREILSEITGVAEAQLGRYKAIYNNLLPELMEEFKNSKIVVSVAVELSGMEEDMQRKAADILQNGGTISLPDVKEMKKQAEEEKGIPGQMEFETEDGQQDAPEDAEEGENEAGEEIHGEAEENAAEGAGEPQDSLCETCINNGECAGKKTHEDGCMGYEQQEEYVGPQPDTVTSLCYSCNNYETCHEKKSTVTSCNAYIDRREARKTDEQRYNEEQAELDRQTREKLREQRQEEKMSQLPSDRETKKHEIITAAGKCEEIESGKLTFLLLKKDGFKEGEEITLVEHEDGSATGRKICVTVQYIWQDWTGLDDDYCIIGFKVTGVLTEAAEEAAGGAEQPVLMPGA